MKKVLRDLENVGELKSNPKKVHIQDKLIIRGFHYDEQKACEPLTKNYELQTYENILE